MTNKKNGPGPMKGKGPGSRRFSRELALKLLLHHEQMGGEAAQALKIFEDCFAPENDDEEILGLASAEFQKAWPLAKDFFLGLTASLARLDADISRAAANWSLSRMSPVDRALLRLAYFEMLFRDDIPAKVSLNEALEIAKDYGDDDSVAFINGVLDRLLKSVAREQ